MNEKAMQATASGLIVAIFSALVSFGVLGGPEASTAQGVALAVVAFVAAAFVRSALPPKRKD